MEFYTAIKNRRSIYGLGKEVTISKERLREIIEESILYTPSAFNSQSARVLVLYGEHHEKLWQIVKESLKKIVPAEAFGPTEEKIQSFARAFGTLLFFDENQTVKELQGKFPTYKDNFPIWANQANGMLQFVIWTALEAEGLGASLQHYNPLINHAVKEEWQLPESWQLVAQMPFGQITADAGEKTFIPVNERVLFFD